MFFQASASLKRHCSSELVKLMNSKRKKRDDEMYRKVLSEAKKNAIIKQFHRIYTNLTGKKFIVENTQENYFEDKYRVKLKKIEIIIGLVAFLSIVNAVAYYELSYDNGVEIRSEEIRSKYSILLYCCTLLSVLLFVLLYFSESICLEYEIAVQKIQTGENIFTSGRYINLIIYFVMIIFHPNPVFVGYDFSMFNNQIKQNLTRSINSLLTILILVRSFFIFRCFIYNSSFMDPESKKICKMYNFESNLIYSLKAIIKHSPMKMYFLSLIILTFVLSYSIRIFERSIQAEHEYNDFNSYWNALWYVFVTMTTVGYGDLTAKTNEGRVIVMLACGVGVFLISMMIVAVINIFSFELSEINGFIILERAEANENTKETAKKVIYNFTKFVGRYSYRKLAVENPKKLRQLNKSIKMLNKICNTNYSTNTADFNNMYAVLTYIFTKQEALLREKESIREKVEALHSRIAGIIKMSQGI